MPGQPQQEETRQTAFRMTVSLIKRIDAHVERLKAASPGLLVTRADVVRILVTQGLDHIEAAAAVAASEPAPPVKAKRARKDAA